MDMDFNLQELKLQHEKVAPPAWTPTQEGNTKQHKILTYKENVDDLVIWLDHFKLVCMMENLNQNLWRTKFVEFLQGELLNLVFSMKKEDCQYYPKIRKALLLRFNYTTKGIHRRFCDSLPHNKQSFL